MRTPQWDAKHPQVPVDKDGNWLHYSTHWLTDRWEDVSPFFDVMVINGMYSGRSAKYLELKSTSSGKTYPMFVSDLVKGIQDGLFRVEKRETGGKLIGRWTASKRGANYGIKAVV